MFLERKIARRDVAHLLAGFRVEGLDAEQRLASGHGKHTSLEITAGHDVDKARELRRDACIVLGARCAETEQGVIGGVRQDRVDNVRERRVVDDGSTRRSVHHLDVLGLDIGLSVRLRRVLLEVTQHVRDHAQLALRGKHVAEVRVGGVVRGDHGGGRVPCWVCWWVG